MASLVALLVNCCRVVGLITCWSCWETGGLVHLLLWSTTHTEVTQQACSGDSLRQRRELKQAFSMSNVAFILALVMSGATVNPF